MLFVIVLIPLWSSYLVRVYAWRLILAKDGILNWFLHQIGLGSVNVAYSNWSVWIVFSYIWLPFMILPGVDGHRACPGLLTLRRPPISGPVGG